MAKLQNFWFYYKKHLLIALSILAVILYLTAQSADSETPDYHIGLVQSVPCTEAELHQLENRLAEAGEDINGDGNVYVHLHTYFVDLADDAPNAGVENAQIVSKLDADLIGSVSGIFLLEDVAAFREITGGILSDTVIPLENGLFLVPRSDADSIYSALADNLS